MSLSLKQLVNAGLAPFGVSMVKTTTDKVRGFDPLRDLQALLAKKTDPVIFDVGANDGETIQEFLKAFPQARVVGFEPFKECYEKLRSQFKELSNVRIENCALGSERGTSRLNVFSGSNMNSLLPMDEHNPIRNSFASTGAVEVQVETLDEFCAKNGYEQIDILKVDTQGFDLHVLNGASRLLASRQVRTILIEANFVLMYQGQPDFLELHRFLSERGYRLVDFYNQARHHGYTAWCDACYVVADETDHAANGGANKVS